MIQLNFLVDNMGNTQLSYYLGRTLNSLADKRADLDAIVFFNTTIRTNMIYKFALMQMIEAWGQRGYTFATSCATMRKMMTFPGPDKRLFYVWDLEWIRGENRNYNMYAPLYQDPRIILIARSKIHADAIRNCFNVDKIHIVDDFNENQLLEVIESEKTITSNSAA